MVTPLEFDPSAWWNVYVVRLDGRIDKFTYMTKEAAKKAWSDHRGWFERVTACTKGNGTFKRGDGLD